MKYIRFIVILIVCLFLCGCSTYWYQDGKTFKECKKDYDECMGEMLKRSEAQDSPDYDIQILEACMIERGYEAMTADKLPINAKRKEPEMSLHWQVRGIAGLPE